MKLPLDLATIRHLEELATGAWPPAAAPELQGWRLRHDAGVSRRANSVQALEYHGADLDQSIRQVESAYREWGLPPRFQLCPACQPTELDAELERRGYRQEALTAVQVAMTAEVFAATRTDHQPEVVVLHEPDERWWSVYATAEGGGEQEEAVRRAILGRVQSPSAYLLHLLDGVPAAVGLGVARGDWAGVFCIATRPEFRRRGAATAVTGSLAGWASRHAAKGLYLQVMDSNRAATELYARLGFRTAYHYHYRTHP